MTSSVLARRLLVTTGLADELPGVPGVAERWGRDVLHCPYCHGWEVRDQVIAVLASGPGAVHQALLFRQLSEHVTVLLNTAPEPGEDVREQLDTRGIAMVEGEVATLEVTGDRLTGVRLRSGQVVPCQALVVQPRFTARAGVLSSLGLETADLEMVAAVEEPWSLISGAVFLVGGVAQLISAVALRRRQRSSVGSGAHPAT